MSQLLLPDSTGLGHFQRGILMSNKALEFLYHYVNERYGWSYIVTNRLNQDILENFFGAIRSKGGLNDHPTPKEFKYRLRKYIMGKIIKNSLITFIIVFNL